MKASRLGLLSAVVASSCCVLPVLLVVTGLGSLGVGSLLGRFHWGFIGGALALLLYAWRVYFKKRSHCRAASCEMEGGKTTRWALLVASLIVLTLISLNLYTYASRRPSQLSLASTTGLAQVRIPVEGMTCFTCQLTVGSSVKKLPGVREAHADVTQHSATITYDPRQITVQQLVEAINKTGYRASVPRTEGSEP